MTAAAKAKGDRAEREAVEMLAEPNADREWASRCPLCDGDGPRMAAHGFECWGCRGSGLARIIPADQWERIAAVVRAVDDYRRGGSSSPLETALDALTPDDIEAVQP